MKIFLIIALFALTISQQCIAGTNCPLNQGICVGGACQCLDGYKTLLNKALPQEEQIFCNYKQINHFIPLTLEFIPGIGLGHFYIGRYWLGIIKLILALTFISCIKYIHDEFRFDSYVETIEETILNKIYDNMVFCYTGGISSIEIARLLFNFTFYPFLIFWIFDIFMFFMNSYNDGNGIPLI